MGVALQASLPENPIEVCRDYVVGNISLDTRSHGQEEDNGSWNCEEHWPSPAKEFQANSVGFRKSNTDPSLADVSLTSEGGGIDLSAYLEKED